MSKKDVKQMPVSSFSLFSKSYDLVVRNWQMFAILSIIPFLSLLGNSKASKYDFNNVPSITVTTILFIAAAGIVFGIASIIIQVMTTALELEAGQDKTPSFKHLWEVAKKFLFRQIGLYIMMGLMILGGLILLIVPGIIMIRRYFLAPYIMINEDLSITETMRRSAALSKPYAASIWGVIGVFILLSLPGGIPRVGPYIAFILALFYSIAPALRYLELKKLA